MSYAKVDHALVEDGVWIELSDGVEVRVRHFNSKAVEAEREKRNAPFRAMIQSGRKLPRHVREKISREVLAHGVLVDWRGDWFGGERFSPEAAVQRIVDYPDFGEDVAVASTTYESFREEEIKAAAGE